MASSRVFIADHPEKSMSFADLVKLCAAEGIHRSELAMFRAPFTDKIDPETGLGQVHPDYVFGAHAIEVAVDTETGEITVLQSVVAAHDVGQHDQSGRRARGRSRAASAQRAAATALDART